MEFRITSTIFSENPLNRRDIKLDATPEVIPKSALLRVRGGDPWSSLPVSTLGEKRLKTPLKRQWQVDRDIARGTQVTRFEGHWHIDLTNGEIYTSGQIPFTSTIEILKNQENSHKIIVTLSKPQSPISPCLKDSFSSLHVSVLLTSQAAACRARFYTADPVYDPSEDPLHGKSSPGAEGMHLRRDARRSD